MDWIAQQVRIFSDWLQSYANSAQLVAVAILTAFFTALVTEPAKAYVQNVLKRRFWKRHIYRELAVTYFTLMFEMDEDLIMSKPRGSPEEINDRDWISPDYQANIAKRFKEPYLTPRYEFACKQPESWLMEEVNTIQQIYRKLHHTFGPGRPQRMLPLELADPFSDPFSDVMDVIDSFEEALQRGHLRRRWFNKFLGHYEKKRMGYAKESIARAHRARSKAWEEKRKQADETAASPESNGTAMQH